MDDLISRRAAIDALIVRDPNCGIDGANVIKGLPSAQPDCSFEIQDILDYLDTVLHPIISPEHWNVYSELHDMISTLPSAQPERKKGKWIRHDEIKNVYGGICIECSECGEKYVVQHILDEKYCRNCGADMRGEKDG